MRAIDADDLKSDLKFPDERLNRVFACMIDNSPTIELVKQAKWIYVKRKFTTMGKEVIEEYYECGNCGYPFTNPYNRKMNYCSHCGAKIVEEEYENQWQIELIENLNNEK